ncbi:MAG: adenine deaminase [Rhizobiales bacterium]|nr:adenine deaminase [Hyphomicrobiales bacterium]
MNPALSLAERTALMKAAAGEDRPDLAIVGGLLANVLSGEFHLADILVKDGRVVRLVEPGEALDLAGVDIVDAAGRHVVPGLIDPHMHLESSSLMPDEFAKAIVARGVTTVAIDPHEFGNVVGLAGIEALMRSTAGLPVRFLLRVPARVPELPDHLETPGRTIDDAGTEAMLGWPEAACLAGDISPNFILSRDATQLRRMQMAYDRGRFVSGYVPQLPGRGIDTMVAGGVQDSHVPKSVGELVANLRHGLHALLTPRPGRFEADSFAELGGLIRRGVIDGRRISLCTDDVLVHELLADGHLDARLRMALRMKVPAMAALQMATLNTATLLRRDDIGAIAPGRHADLAIVSDLENFVVDEVLFGGQRVAAEGRCTLTMARTTLPDFTRSTIVSDMPASAEALQIPVAGDRTAVRCNVLVSSHPKTLARKDLPVVSGYLRPDVEGDVLALAVVERYHSSGRIGRGFVSGFGLQRGAVASSTNHNNHHVFALGADYGDMKLALDELKRLQGGYVAVLEGRIVASLQLPVIGMISDLPAEELAGAMADFERRMVEVLGCSVAKRPMYALNFICSPVVMNYGMTDFGLVDSANLKPVPLFPEG